MTAPTTLRTVYTHWARNFGCQVGVLLRPGTTVVPHAALGHWPGIFLLRQGSSCIVSAPEPCVTALRLAVQDREPDEVFDAAYVERLLGDRVERIVGPACLAYVDAAGFRPVDPGETRFLDAADLPRLLALAAACGDDAWEHSGIRFDRPPIAGRFAGGELVGAGTLEDAGDTIQNVGIVTHPRHRGRGYGRQVVSLLTEHALSRGTIPQYRTLLENAPSVAIARSLGYQEQARTLAIRLHGG